MPTLCRRSLWVYIKPSPIRPCSSRILPSVARAPASCGLYEAKQIPIYPFPRLTDTRPLLLAMPTPISADSTHFNSGHARSLLQDNVVELTGASQPFISRERAQVLTDNTSIDLSRVILTDATDATDGPPTRLPRLAPLIPRRGGETRAHETQSSGEETQESSRQDRRRRGPDRPAAGRRMLPLLGKGHHGQGWPQRRSQGFRVRGRR